MGFTVGDTVGPYKIVEFVGQGGMATIYKAHQTSLDRFVALKVIHPALKDDQAYLERLKREASIIARLNHPNIVTVYDFSQSDGTPFLVLRFIEGKTLKAVLQQQRLGTQQILKIIRPIADALMYAHSRGVLHRDVKPSNILIDNDGHVYLTDFGLARIAHSGESTSSQDMIIGSPHYISPEQAKSEAVDARSDIYSLGIILYEMFTGRVPFTGETPYGTVLAQINEKPPAPRVLNPKIKAAIEQVILKALAKEPKQRYSSVREMMRALENAVRGPQEAEEEAAAVIPLADYKPSRALPLPNSISNVGDQIKSAAAALGGKSSLRNPMLLGAAALLAVLVLILCIAGAALALRAPLFQAATTPRGTLPAQTSIAGSVATPAATNAPVSTPVASAPAATLAAPTATRAPTTLASPSTSARPPVVPVDAPRGKIAYSITTGDLAEQHSIWIADADGTNAQKVTDLAMYPALSPDGKQIAYYRFKDEGIYVANVDGGNAHIVANGETCCVQWSRDSKRLVYLQGKLKVGDTHIKVVGADGTNTTEIVVGPSPYNPTWSPDDTKIAYAACQSAQKNQCGIFVYDLNAKVSKMITQDGGGNPQWSPRGDKIVYQVGNPNVFVVNADGSGGIKQLTFGKSHDGQPVWSSDGNFIFWRSDQDGKGWAIYAMRADGSDKRLLINNALIDQDRWGYESLSASP